MSGEFSDKVAVITGGSRGIGREIAADLARAGAQTVILDYNNGTFAMGTTTAGQGTTVNIGTNAADKLKFLAGSEQGAGTFISDTLPEETAVTLRDAIARAS